MPQIRNILYPCPSGMTSPTQNSLRTPPCQIALESLMSVPSTTLLSMPRIILFDTENKPVLYEACNLAADATSTKLLSAKLKVQNLFEYSCIYVLSTTSYTRDSPTLVQMRYCMLS